MSYWRFGGMILTSTVVMFILMYLNTYALEHVFWSETRTYMAIMMGAAMAVIMLSFMLTMYSSSAVNGAIYLGAIVVFAISLWLVRSQATVEDRSFMRAMIPHHSIAIMTSQRAGISDARVDKLSSEIVRAQNREIAEMRYLIADIGRAGEIGEIYEDPGLTLGSVEDALNATLVAALDPAPLPAENLPETVQADGFDCGFRRVRSEAPVLWTGEESALMRLNGVVIALERQEADGTQAWGAQGVTMTVRDVDDAGWRGGAELVFALERGLTVGYRGFYDCDV